MHEWVSFEDGDGDTYVFDLTFLTSNWTCVFGAGCQGVLDGPAAELEQGCCSYGAHFSSDEDVARVKKYVKRLTPDDWQFHREAKRLGGPITVVDGETVSRLVDDACIFLNRPGFEGGPGCALHRAALRTGERPLDWKPDVCWQLPLRLDDHTDENGFHTFTLREWKRRDWGEGGPEFHWWCTDDSLAFRDRKQVWQTLRDEICEMVGDDMYANVVKYIKARAKRTETLLPHPAVRRRTRAPKGRTGQPPAKV